MRHALDLGYRGRLFQITAFEQGKGEWRANVVEDDGDLSATWTEDGEPVVHDWFQPRGVGPFVCLTNATALILALVDRDTKHPALAYTDAPY